MIQFLMQLDLMFVGLVGIFSLAHFFTNFRVIRSFHFYAAILGITLIGSDLAILCFNHETVFKIMSLPVLLLVNFFAFLKIFIFTGVGCKWSLEKNLVPDPSLHICKVPGKEELADRKVFGLSPSFLAYIFAVSWSVLIIMLCNGSSNEETLKQVFGETNIAEQGSFAQFFILWIFINLQVSISEEVSFRLLIQNFLAGQRVFVGRISYGLAILLSALAWTFVHGPVMNPVWLKYLQIFPIGLALGSLYKTRGLRECIKVHFFFNQTMAIWAYIYFV